MGELKSRLDQVDRDIVIDDTVKLIDEEVKSKGGLSGMALKGGYKVVKRLKGGRMIEEAVDGLLDEFSEALDPLYEDFLEQDTPQTFERYLERHDNEATDALLSITDSRAKRADNKVLKKTYNKLRGQAEKHVKQALPGVGRLVDEHAPRE